MNRRRGREPAKPSGIPGAPPGGVSRPMEKGGYESLGRYGTTGVDDAMQSMGGNRVKSARRRRRASWPDGRQEQQAEQADDGYTQPPPMNLGKRKGKKLPPPPETLPLPGRSRGAPSGSGADIEFDSADGNYYRFEKPSKKGAKDKSAQMWDLILTVLIAIVEHAKSSGDVHLLTVLKSCGLRMKDADGEKFFDHADVGSYLRELERGRRGEVAEDDYDDDYEEDNDSEMSSFVEWDKE